MNLRAAIIGNPNCGKTTLFNALTGDHQAVGNWSGVTVAEKIGNFNINAQTITLIDLPGVYSLTRFTEDSSTDAYITSNYVVKSEFDLIINVIDACHLERHLYLTTQLLELNKPIIIVLSMLDIAKKRGIKIDTQILSDQFGCLVVENKQDLCIKIFNAASNPASTVLNFSTHINEQLNTIQKQWCLNSNLAEYVACRVAEGDEILMPNYTPNDPNLDLEMADKRYNKIHQIVLLAQQKISDKRENITACVDRFVLHRWLGIPIFFTIIYMMFFFTVNIGGLLQDVFDVGTRLIFVNGFEYILNYIHTPQWLVALCANGIGQGLHTTLTFVPVMALMFFSLSWLEASGYMARAAFVMDRAMRLLKLPGKAFVPLIMGFGCNVPAIMATRTLQSDYDRKLTMLMTPFMSCSARLAIYSVFVAAFFPQNGHNVVFSLYLLGIGMAIITGMIVRKTLLQGKTSSLIIELPAYHLPELKRLVSDTMRKLKNFVWRAGKLIIPVSIVLGCLNSWFIVIGNSEPISILALIGKTFTPIFYPMGIQSDNWPATVSLLTGMLAKEVVIGSLNGLYMQMNQLTSLDLIPVVMQQHFISTASAYAYLVFILLYIPCISTMAAIRQESNRYLMLFSVGWSLFVAYITAVICYQCMTFTDHPQQTLIWLIGIVLLCFISQKGKNYVVSIT
jgi:ferrous iron transport protein B